MQYKNTINEILKDLSNDFSLAKKGDIAETLDTLYVLPTIKNNVTINGKVMTIPLAASKETKKLFKKEKSPVAEIYNDFKAGDILLIKECSDNNLLVENLSIKKEFRIPFYIEKIDILKRQYNVIKRKTLRLIETLQNIDELKNIS